MSNRRTVDDTPIAPSGAPAGARGLVGAEDVRPFVPAPPALPEPPEGGEGGPVLPLHPRSAGQAEAQVH